MSENRDGIISDRNGIDISRNGIRTDSYRIKENNSRTMDRQYRLQADLFQDSEPEGLVCSHPQGLSLTGFSSGATLPVPDGWKT